MSERYTRLFANSRSLSLLKTRTPQIDGSEHWTAYSLLIPVIQTQEGASFLYEIRSDDLKLQPGEICFPGGQIEPGESPEEAACRECCEELCVESGQIRILGEGNPLVMPFNMIIYPYLAELTDYQWTFSRSEVGDVFAVPLFWLAKHQPEVYLATIQHQQAADFPFERIRGGRDYPWRNGSNPIYFYRYGAHDIWGITARVTRSCMQILNQVIQLSE